MWRKVGPRHQTAGDAVVGNSITAVAPMSSRTVEDLRHEPAMGRSAVVSDLSGPLAAKSEAVLTRDLDGSIGAGGSLIPASVVYSRTVQPPVGAAASIVSHGVAAPLPPLTDNNAFTNHHIDEIPDSDLIDYSDDGGESLRASVATDDYDSSADLIRIFVALFDYDPSTMSPNPDAVDVELPFREGQIMQVLE